MDERQTQIKEGAGLEESRLNTDFIEALQKWSLPVLLLMVGGLGGFLGLQKLDEARQAKIDNAYSEYQEVRGSTAPSPTSLLAIAEQYSDVKGVVAMARLSAADLYMLEANTAMTLGAELSQGGVPVDPSAVLNESDRLRRLDQAAAQYEIVFGMFGASPNSGEAVHAIGAAFGMASVHESKLELDDASSWYDRVIQIASSAGFRQHQRIAEDRKAELAGGLNPPRMWSTSDLPAGSLIALNRNTPLILLRPGDDLQTEIDRATEEAANPFGDAQPMILNPDGTFSNLNDATPGVVEGAEAGEAADETTGDAEPVEAAPAGPAPDQPE